MKQLARSLTTPVVFVTAFLLFGAPGAPAVWHLPSMGEVQAYPGCGNGRVSRACTSFCMAYERCITGGGAASCNEELNAVLTCINIPEVVVVGYRVVTRVPVMIFRRSYSGYRLSWSDFWNTWYAHVRTPPPPPEDGTFVGKCSRPVDIFTLPAGIPASVRAWVESKLPQHHDVRTRKVAAGAITQHTRGFFAVDMTRAVLAAIAWRTLPIVHKGFVEGVVRNSAATAGSCNLSNVSGAHDTALANILKLNEKKYHLVNYNCQHWAAEMSGL